jgi:hypothetical protein
MGISWHGPQEFHPHPGPPLSRGKEKRPQDLGKTILGRDIGCPPRGRAPGAPIGCISIFRRPMGITGWLIIDQTLPLSSRPGPGGERHRGRSSSCSGRDLDLPDFLEPGHHNVFIHLDPEQGAGGRRNEILQIGVLFQVNSQELLPFRPLHFPGFPQSG